MEARKRQDRFKIAHPMATRLRAEDYGVAAENMARPAQNHIIRTSAVVREVTYWKGRDSPIEHLIPHGQVAIVLRLAYSPGW